MTPITWNLDVTDRHVKEDGTVLIRAVLSDDVAEQGTLTVTMTPGRDLRVLWEDAPDGAGLAGFYAVRKDATS